MAPEGDVNTNEGYNIVTVDGRSAASAAKRALGC